MRRSSSTGICGGWRPRTPAAAWCSVALPGVRTAFEGGEVSWSQVRLLIGVATPNTQAEWLEIARGRTVRALATRIREDGRSATEDEIEEPSARFRLRCPRRVLRLWGNV